MWTDLSEACLAESLSDNAQELPVRNPILAMLIGCALVVARSQPLPQDTGDRVRNHSTNPVTGALLGDKTGWIWIRQPDSTYWQRLIPGRCPRWSFDGKRFYYFLHV